MFLIKYPFNMNEDWLNNLTQNTQSTYLGAIKYLCKFLNIDNQSGAIEKLINIALLPNGQNEILMLCDKIKNQMVIEDYSNASINICISTISSLILAGNRKGLIPYYLRPSHLSISRARAKKISIDNINKLIFYAIHAERKYTKKLNL